MSTSQPAPRAGAATIAARALVALFLGLGLVLMHHVIAVPYEPGDGSTPAAVAIAVHAAPAGHGAGDPEDSHGEHASMLLHLCLAVLVAAVAVTALLLPVHLVARVRDEAPGGGLVVAPVPRPPPVPDRLARLQILRL